MRKSPTVWNGRHWTAFTLIELLIVVATIALLLAILLPGLRGARQFANGITCQANLSQITKAWQMYLNVHDGAFCQGINVNLTYGGWKGDTSNNLFPPLPRPLNPFVALPADLGLNLPPKPDWNASETIAAEEGAKVFRCPNDNGGVPNTTTLCFQNFGTSYQTNLLLIGQNKILERGTGVYQPLNAAINNRLKKMNVSRAADPSHLILIGDYGWVSQWAPGTTLKIEWHNRAAYHNVAFLDGHVEIVRIRQGLYVTPAYRVLPFEDLDELAYAVQQETP
jgi:prepilin-type processing-associated H-X9-DG protein